jgi:hypothetical protein
MSRGAQGSVQRVPLVFSLPRSRCERDQHGLPHAGRDADDPLGDGHQPDVLDRRQGASAQPLTTIWNAIHPGTTAGVDRERSDLDDGLVHGDAVVVDDGRGGEHLAVIGQHELDAHDGPEPNQVPDAFIGVITMHLDDPAVLARH